MNNGIYYTISELFRLQPLEAGHELYGNYVRQAEHTDEHRQPAGTFSTEKWHIPAETSSYAKQSMRRQSWNNRFGKM
jgi:hypothetical protein